MKISVSLAVVAALFQTMSALALECSDLGSEIRLVPVAITTEDGVPQLMDDDGSYKVIQPNCNLNEYTVLEYHPDNQGVVGLELKYQFSVGKISSTYEYIRHPIINTMVHHTLIAHYTSDALTIHDSLVQLNPGDAFPTDASSSQGVLEVTKDARTGKWAATSTIYSRDGIYGMISYAQK